MAAGDAARRAFARAGLLAAGLLALSGGQSRAVEAVFWSAMSPSELAAGTADGISVSAGGALSLAPRLDRLTADLAGGQSQPFFWSAALDGSGNLYVGTGSGGRLLRISPSGRVEQLAELAEPQVTALAVARGGEVFAATSPQGAIYRIGSGGAVSVHFDPDERYIWSLAVSPDGRLYAGTGERGRIYRIDEAGTGSVFFDGDDPHIVSLAFDRRDGLVAGTDGRGLVIRIDAGGAARVILDTDQREVTGLSVDGAGNVLAAAFSEPGRPPRGTEVRLRVGAGREDDPSLDGPSAPADLAPPLRAPRREDLTAVIEGLREPARPGPGAERAVLYRISPRDEIEKVWSSTTEAIYSLAAGADGAVWFGTGSPSRVRRLDEPGRASLVWNLPQAQVTALLVDRRGRLYAATSNSGAAYRIGAETVERGVFTSRPIDGGFLARWGRARWEAAVPAGGRVEIQTRTGSSPLPDATWSPWSPPLPNPEGSPVPSPPARYLQWRAVLSGDSDGSPVVSSLTLSSQPGNLAPRIGEVSVPDAGEPPPVGTATAVAHPPPPASPTDAAGAGTNGPSGAAPGSAGGTAPGGASGGKGQRTRWAVFRAEDPNADTLVYRLLVRSERGEERRIDPLREGGPPLEWDDSALPEGRWTLTVEVSDERDNPPGSERVARSGPVAFEVDRTPPALERAPEGGSRREIRIRARDALSVLRRAEYSLDGGPWRAAAVADGILDGREEEILISRPDTATPLAVRVRDAAGNESRLDFGNPAGAGDAARAGDAPADGGSVPPR